MKMNYVTILVLIAHILQTDALICTESKCEFELIVRQRRSMTYDAPNGKTYNVAWNETEGKLQVVENYYRTPDIDDFIGTFVDGDDVITTDGFTRNIYVINEQFPGPTLEVMEGAQVTVNVKNDLGTESFAVHFHGQHMRNNVWMDGAGYVTQCPIMPGHSFEYKFTADPAGTFFYHSHFSNTRMDGLYGAFIVHRNVPILPYHILTVQDWYHHDAATIRIMNPHNSDYPGTGEAFNSVANRDYSVDGIENAGMRFISSLIGGRGRRDGVMEKLPLTTYDVVSGSRYRFHAINTGAKYSLEVMVDDHKLDIVAIDGFEVRTLQVDSFILSPAGRIDFEIQTDATPGQFWIRAQTIREGVGLNVVRDGIIKGTKAILRYDDISLTGDPSTLPKECTESNPCVVFNCPYLKYRDDQFKTCLTLNDAESIYTDSYLQTHFGVEDEDFEEYFFDFSFGFGSSINGRKFAHPTAPYSGDNSDHVIHCDEDACKHGCRCTHIVQLPFNKTIQMVWSNLATINSVAHHNVHLHGHSFVVLKMGFPSYNSTTGLWEQANDDIICNNALCTRPSWNGQRPQFNEKGVIRDTAFVPGRGYTVLRFRADNPGIWFMHCHMKSHMREGMAMLFNEAPGMHPPVPRDFPTCGNFRWKEEETPSETEDSTTNKGPCPGDSSLETSKEDDKDNIEMSTDAYIGGSVGLIILGAVLATVPTMIYACCISKQNRKNLDHIQGIKS